MKGRSGKILVIDDDELVLIAIADLLEEAGYAVVTRSTPIGATRVAAEERVDLIVIDINMPVMQGDSVVRLLQSWDRMRDMPFVIISGASSEKLGVIRDQLQEVAIVPKTTMNDSLVPTVARVLQDRTKPRRETNTRLAPVGSPRSSSSSDVGRELTQRFTQDLARAVDECRQLWRDVSMGDARLRKPVTESMRRLHGQAQLLGLAPVAELVMGLLRVIEEQPVGAPIPSRIDGMVESAMTALQGLRRSSDAEFVVSPKPIVHGLKEVHAELARASH